jgi:hypothetical protein
VKKGVKKKGVWSSENKHTKKQDKNWGEKRKIKKEERKKNEQKQKC